jgi:two-component system, sensor histidine kinase and response regulator
MAFRQIYDSKILIVDDVVDNLDMLTDMLKDQGHTVLIATSGTEALAAVAEHLPDLILLDIQMPLMNGYEVCEHIKSNPATQDIPVIFLSALAETRDIVRGFEVGGADYISKPFQFREVVARVNSQLVVSHQRKEIEALRERDRQQYEQLTRMKDQFLHTTAHDLKNPLAGILLYSQLLKSDDPQDTANLPEIADGIAHNVRKMQRLITDILDLAQMQIGEGIYLTQTDLVTMVQKSLQEYDILARENHIDLRFQPPASTVLIDADSHLFERVIDNLISNAIKYTPPQGQVTISIQQSDQQIVLSIQDTGIGIPPEDLPHVFEAFYRVRKPSHRKASGSGLGLSIVATIVEQHNGFVHVESEPERGSLFTVILPATG